jgi:hypothetical protein
VQVNLEGELSDTDPDPRGAKYKAGKNKNANKKDQAKTDKMKKDLQADDDQQGKRKGNQKKGKNNKKDAEAPPARHKIKQELVATTADANTDADTFVATCVKYCQDKKDGQCFFHVEDKFKILNFVNQFKPKWY